MARSAPYDRLYVENHRYAAHTPSPLSSPRTAPHPSALAAAAGVVLAIAMLAAAIPLRWALAVAPMGCCGHEIRAPEERASEVFRS